MTEVLLEELTESDIEWIAATGHQQTILINQPLIQQGDLVDAFYIVLEGTLVATKANDLASPLGRALSVLSEEPTSSQDILRCTTGEVLGETSFLIHTPSAVTVRSQENASVLVLPYGTLQSRLNLDLGFASRFYRAIAILILNRFEQLLETFTRRKGLQVPPLQDGPLLFGELNDGDINWMIEHAVVQEMASGQMVIRAGRAVEYLYIVLRGLLSISLFESQRRTMNDIFSQLAGGTEIPGRQIAQASRGEIMGETALLSSRLSTFTVKAEQPSLLLALPRQQLSLELQRNQAMGARFYRVLAMLLSSRLEGLMSRLGYGQATYRIGNSLAQTIRYDDEIDLELIDTVNLGGARFDWMLQRLNVRGIR